MNGLSLDGNLGPERVDSVRNKLERLLSQPRPLVEIDLSGVTTMHLSIVNMLIAARHRARTNLGDISVVVSSGSEAQHLLEQVGIVGTMRP